MSPPEPPAGTTAPLGENSENDVSSPGRGAARLVPGARLLERYVLERQAGRGAMGVVWSARDEELGKRVALKFLPELLAADRQCMSRMRGEANVLLDVTHENIVRLHTLQSLDDLTFLVMEYLEGPSLAEYQQDLMEAGERGLPPEHAHWILAQLAPALDYAHAKGITHRDIKPSNVLLTRPIDGKLLVPHQAVKLADFGIAFVASASLTQLTGYQPSGTLIFMAPEILRGKMPTPAADIYSLGASLYNLLAGRSPFTHGDLTHQILNEAAPELACGDANLQRAVMATLAKEPEDRPATAGEFLALARGEATVVSKVGAKRGSKATRAKAPEKRARSPADTTRLSVGVSAALLVIAIVAVWKLVPGPPTGAPVQAADRAPEFVAQPTAVERSEPREELPAPSGELLARAESELSAGELEAALGTYADVLQIAPRATDALIGRGIALRRLDRYAEANEALSRALFDGSNARAYRERALVNLMSERRAAALRDAENAVRLDSKAAEGFAIRGGVHLAESSFDRCLDDVEAALELDGKCALAYFFRALYRNTVGDDRLALADLDQSVRLDPSFVPALAIRAVFRLDEGRFGQAQEDVTRALELSPDSPDALLASALLRNHDGDSIGAIRIIDRAIELHPENPILYVARSIFRIEIGRLPSAQRDAEKALQLDPEQDDANVLVATFRLGQGRIREAEALVERVIRGTPYSAQAHMIRGQIRQLEGDYFGARADFRTAKELDPDLMDDIGYAGRDY